MPGSATSAIQPIPPACSSGPPTRKGRSPWRSTSAPATGATKNSVRVHGQHPQPRPERAVPEPACRNWAMKNTAQNSDADREEHRDVARRERPARKKRIGSIGSRARSSQATNAMPSSSAAAERADDLGAAPARRVAAHEAPHDAERRARDEPQPGQVERAVGPAALRQPAQDERDEREPDGTLSQKIHCQASPSAIAPPTSGPLATASPVTPKKMPSAPAAALGREGGADDRERRAS